MSRLRGGSAGAARGAEAWSPGTLLRRAWFVSFAKLMSGRGLADPVSQLAQDQQATATSPRIHQE